VSGEVAGYQAYRVEITMVMQALLRVGSARAVQEKCTS